MPPDAPTTTLFRPTGPEELRLVEASGWRRWPPRLADQPIFYPVTNEAYAAEIASKWNARDGKPGFVTRFEVRTVFMDRYPIQTVGSRTHTEWWVPAEELEALNDNIVGLIEVVRTFP
ncbi:MAG TPA: ADP-ribosylation/crystallin J1 [Polyangiaceae bacterium]|nr:ADP-ribosylation/crystallin J1 [Polyangiaceae bacterium]HMR81078.1 ADP-ribosylation/crystallin J1 [Polyangiaceae bacterium]